MDPNNYGENVSDFPGGSTSSSCGRDGSTVDTIKSAIAEKLHTAAVVLQEKVKQANDQNGTLVRYGRCCSDWLEHSADYVRDLKLSQLNKDIQNQVKRNPGRSILIGAALGLCLGAWMRRGRR
jgi:ElaB/YqjD/DUF883 family membrane-anchored ribosome-binding protein